jgi:hypothetical protein
MDVLMALHRVGTAMMVKLKYPVTRGKQKTGVRPPEHGRALAVHAVQLFLPHKISTSYVQWWCNFQNIL